jgi:integrase
METLRTFARENASADPYGITVSDLHEWMAGKAWARETRRGRKSTLASFYGWAVDTEHMTVDPTLKLPTVKAGDPVARPATDAEYTAALERAGERWELALRLGAELGLRRGEVARVHSADVVDRGEAGSWLTVHGKGAKVRTLPLSASLALSLRTRPPGYVYPGRIVEKQRARGEGHISARYLGKRIEQLLPDGVTMHALRHRFATRAYNVNRDVFTVQKLLGHASAATTQRYVQVADDRMRALVEAVSG